MPSLHTLPRRRIEAEQRQAEYDALSPQEKLDRAVQRGHENSREALRLRAAMEAKNGSD